MPTRGTWRFEPLGSTPIARMVVAPSCAGTGLVQDRLWEMFPEFTRFFDAHRWAKGPSQLTQKSDCHCMGVNPGLAAVTFMSAMTRTPCARVD